MYAHGFPYLKHRLFQIGLELQPPDNDEEHHHERNAKQAISFWKQTKKVCAPFDESLRVEGNADSKVHGQETVDQPMP